MDTGFRNQKPLLLLAVALVLISASIFGTIFYLQHQADMPPSPIPYKLDASGQVTITPEQNQGFIDRAKELREKWRVWAVKHQDSIKLLLNAPTTDRKALDEVYKALPEAPDVANAGVDKIEFGSRPFRFTWNKIPQKRSANPEAFNDPKARQLFDGEDQVNKEEREKDYLSQRDICIARSVNPGALDYKLWVSGRITKVSYAPGQNRHEEEIAPSYEFLR